METGAPPLRRIERTYFLSKSAGLPFDDGVYSAVRLIEIYVSIRDQSLMIFCDTKESFKGTPEIRR